LNERKKSKMDKTKRTEIVALPAQWVEDVLALMVEHAPSYVDELNGVYLEIDAMDTFEQAVAKYEAAFRKRWKAPTFKLRLRKAA
jgi:hypothetical protein